MGEETIGHYASHPGGGYQPTKTDKPKAQNPPESSGIHYSCWRCGKAVPLLSSTIKDDRGAYICKSCLLQKDVSELELRIRKEVLDAVNIMSELLSECEQCNDNWGMSCSVTRVYIEHITTIKDRLNLLWGK